MKAKKKNLIHIPIKFKLIDDYYYLLERKFRKMEDYFFTEVTLALLIIIISVTVSFSRHHIDDIITHPATSSVYVMTIGSTCLMVCLVGKISRRYQGKPDNMFTRCDHWVTGIFGWWYLHQKGRLFAEKFLEHNYPLAQEFKTMNSSGVYVSHVENLALNADTEESEEMVPVVFQLVISVVSLFVFIWLWVTKFAIRNTMFPSEKMILRNLGNDWCWVCWYQFTTVIMSCMALYGMTVTAVTGDIQVESLMVTVNDLISWVAMFNLLYIAISKSTAPLDDKKPRSPPASPVRDAKKKPKKKKRKQKKNF